MDSKYQYYTSKKPVIIIFMVFMSDENVSPNFEKEEKGGNFHLFSDRPYYNYYSKKNNGAIDRCVPQISQPVQNGSL